MQTHAPSRKGRTGQIGKPTWLGIDFGTIQIIVMTTCVAALWLITRPYYGIFHDSIFYTLQALNAIYPGRFHEDLYFKFGSQDQFTLFTYIYAPAIRLLGLSLANLALTILAQALWLAGLVYFIRGFTRQPRDILMSMALVIAIPATYGSNQLLGYGEPFLTPRLLAEAMILTAMGLLVRGRPLSALLLAGLSATMHPIMVLPGLAVIFVHEARHRRPVANGRNRGWSYIHRSGRSGNFAIFPNWCYVRQRMV